MPSTSASSFRSPVRTACLPRLWRVWSTGKRSNTMNQWSPDRAEKVNTSLKWPKSKSFNSFWVFDVLIGCSSITTQNIPRICNTSIKQTPHVDPPVRSIATLRASNPFALLPPSSPMLTPLLQPLLRPTPAIIHLPLSLTNTMTPTDFDQLHLTLTSWSRPYSTRRSTTKSHIMT